MKILLSLMLFCICLNPTVGVSADEAEQSAAGKRLVYLVSDSRIPFWDIMGRGIQQQAHKLGYQLQVLSAHNQAKQELKNAIAAIHNDVDGIIVSPTNSSACVTILEFAQQAEIPVVIADVGTESGSYVSYISSDNFTGAYQLGLVLGKKLQQLGLQQGLVGIIAVPQSRVNGKARTLGFAKALDESGIRAAGIVQQVDFSYQETYQFTRQFIEKSQKLKVIWLQGSDRYQAALDAIKDAGKQGEILLLTFDAELSFLQLIPKGTILAAAMQQPYLMGEQAVMALDAALQGKTVDKEIKLSVLPISADNIEQMMPTIKRNVLGIMQ